MSYSVAIIGSFQKYYSDILEIIKIFKNAGLKVLSPKESFISGKIEDFVLFESDRKDFTPAEIQMITLEKIVNADAVYVYNPNGYVGKTTCYEIGFCFCKKKPIYFFDYPEDLPIPVLKDQQVLTPKAFSNLVAANGQHFLQTYNLSYEAHKSFCNLLDINSDIKTTSTKNIVICGSMMFFDDMLKCQRKLRAWGINAIIPKEENESIKLYDEKQFIEFKKKVSRTYLKKIRDRDTFAVLIYNAPKNGIDNYIGANTLVELAMAFTWNRKIFLYNDIYHPLKDELMAWDCICLNGNLDRLKDFFTKEDMLVRNISQVQLSIFDDQ